MTASERRIVVAINPTASFGAGAAPGSRAVTELRRVGYDVEALAEPNYELLRNAAARALEHGAHALVVVGGDGMVSLGANLVAGTDVPLGIVATGTGNDTARSLGLPFDDPDRGIQSLIAALERGPRSIDVARARHGESMTWFAGAVSAGFDAAVNERANRMSWPRGARRYIIALVRELLTFRPIHYRLTADGAAEDVDAMLISVANGQSIGGGMRITPDALLDDGLLDLFIVAPMSRLHLLRVLPKVFSGTHTSLPQVRFRRVRTVRIEAAGVVAYADGERLGALPVDIDVVPGALKVLA